MRVFLAGATGVIRASHYQAGKFLNAMNPACAECNEQNTVTVEGEGHTIVFKQIAGLIARRVVCWKKQGDLLRRGERIGLVRFGSRADLWLPSDSEILVKVGDHVKGGSSVLARWPVAQRPGDNHSSEQNVLTAGRRA